MLSEVTHVSGFFPVSKLYFFSAFGVFISVCPIRFLPLKVVYSACASSLTAGAFRTRTCAFHCIIVEFFSYGLCSFFVEYLHHTFILHLAHHIHGIYTYP